MDLMRRDINSLRFGRSFDGAQAVSDHAMVAGKKKTHG
jgi:hypothetical protein